MALTTTIGGATSDSYVSASDYAAYVVANIDADFSEVASINELNLRRAAQYIDRRYEGAFVGMRQYQFQSLQWPRLTNHLVQGWPIDPDTVPQAIKNAQMELAHQIQTGEVDPFESVSATIKSEKLGPLETEYQGGLSTPRLTAINDALRPYLVGGGQARVRRG